MAKNKTKKKYVPKPITFPSIIIAHNAFHPIETALERLVEKGEIEVDEVGNYIYKNTNGAFESFEAGLLIYTRVCQILCADRHDTLPQGLIKLREQMLEKQGFDEEVIEEAREAMRFSRAVISSVPRKLLTETAKTIAEERRNGTLT